MCQSQSGDRPARRLWEDPNPPPQPVTELLDTGRYNWYSNSWPEGETEPTTLHPSSGGTRGFNQPPSARWLATVTFVATRPRGPQSYTIPLGGAPSRKLRGSSLTLTATRNQRKHDTA